MAISGPSLLDPDLARFLAIIDDPVRQAAPVVALRPIDQLQPTVNGAKPRPSLTLVPAGAGGVSLSQVPKTPIATAAPAPSGGGGQAFLQRMIDERTSRPER